MSHISHVGEAASTSCFVIVRAIRIHHCKVEPDGACALSHARTSASAQALSLRATVWQAPRPACRSEWHVGDVDDAQRPGALRRQRSSSRGGSRNVAPRAVCGRHAAAAAAATAPGARQRGSGVRRGQLAGGCRATAVGCQHSGASICDRLPPPEIMLLSPSMDNLGMENPRGRPHGGGK